MAKFDAFVDYGDGKPELRTIKAEPYQSVPVTLRGEYAMTVDALEELIGPTALGVLDVLFRRRDLNTGETTCTIKGLLDHVAGVRWQGMRKVLRKLVAYGFIVNHQARRKKMDRPVGRGAVARVWAFKRTIYGTRGVATRGRQHVIVMPHGVYVKLVKAPKTRGWGGKRRGAGRPRKYERPTVYLPRVFANAVTSYVTRHPTAYVLTAKPDDFDCPDWKVQKALSTPPIHVPVRELQDQIRVVKSLSYNVKKHPNRAPFLAKDCPIALIDIVNLTAITDQRSCENYSSGTPARENQEGPPDITYKSTVLIRGLIRSSARADARADRRSADAAVDNPSRHMSSPQNTDISKQSKPTLTLGVMMDHVFKMGPKVERPSGGFKLPPRPIDMHARRGVPRYPDLRAFRSAQVPPPPLLPHDDEEAIEHLVRAFRAAVNHRYRLKGKRKCMAYFKRGSAAQSKFRSLLLAAAQTMREREYAPMAWCAFMVDLWRGKGDFAKKTLPTINYVYATFGKDDGGNERLLDWFEREAGQYSAPRVITPPAGVELLRRYELLSRALVGVPDDDRRVARIVAHYFPGSLYEDLCEQANAQAFEMTSRYDDLTRRGDWPGW